MNALVLLVIVIALAAVVAALIAIIVTDRTGPVVNTTDTGDGPLPADRGGPGDHAFPPGSRPAGPGAEAMNPAVAGDPLPGPVPEAARDDLDERPET